MSRPEYDRNIPFNALPLLPPPEEVENDPVVLKKLVVSSRALASVNTNILRLPNPYMLVNTIALQEAKASTAIENIFTTEDELYKAASETIRDEHIDTATKEVLRYREALWAGYENLKENKLIDFNMVLRVVQKIKDTPLGLRSPHAMVTIKRGESEFRAGEVIYTPPRGNEIVGKLIHNLLEYLNDDEKYPTDPLLKMCFAHYQFEAIHPFQDGNGRTGRILNLLYLINKGLLSQPTLYLSKYIIQYKDDYYYKLGTVTQRADWKDWILFMLDAVEKTAHLTNRMIDEILQQMEATLEYGKTELKWYNKELNETIYTQPYIKPTFIADTLGKTSRTTLVTGKQQCAENGN